MQHSAEKRWNGRVASAPVPLTQSINSREPVSYCEVAVKGVVGTGEAAGALLRIMLTATADEVRERAAAALRDLEGETGFGDVVQHLANVFWSPDRPAGMMARSRSSCSGRPRRRMHSPR